jgi:hypothetical protein
MQPYRQSDVLQIVSEPPPSAKNIRRRRKIKVKKYFIDLVLN